MKLFKKILFKGTLELKTGLHIGDSKETVDIGGVDSPIVRRKDNNQPYIPGSSLKGKMRSLLEILAGKSDTFKEPSHPIGKLFGALGSNKDGVPSRIIVRDASLNKGSANKLYKSEYTDMPYSEVKFENVIDRVRGVAEHPRQIERIPAGSIFDIEFVINIIANSQEEAEVQEKEFIATFKKGIALLQDDYLGGSGSRGYGQIEIKLNDPEFRTNEYYTNASI
jgi:CRISPR-associated protein Csm3